MRVAVGEGFGRNEFPPVRIFLREGGALRCAVGTAGEPVAGTLPFEGISPDACLLGSAGTIPRVRGR